MSIPITDRIEYPVSSIGSESIPSSVIVGSTLWTMFSSFGNLYLKEYESGLNKRVRIGVSHFDLSIALNSDNSINPDKFWLWEITPENILNLVEIEPHPGSNPTVIDVTQIKAGILRSKAIISPNKYVKVFCLNSTIPKTLDLLVYHHIKTAVIDYSTNIFWNSTRLEDLGGNLIQTPSKFFISSLDVVSPPEVYEDEYTFEIPSIILIEQVVGLLKTHLIWTSVIGADIYVVERSKEDPLFFTPTEVYRGPLTDIQDIVPDGEFVYYYRIKARIDSADLESDWSPIESIFIVGLFADFNASPILGYAPLTVQFTDTSTGSPASWDWDFGDGSTSTEQNPSHIYTVAGVYTVTLSVNGGASTKTRIDYITVNIAADFTGSPIEGEAPLSVVFTDTSTGSPDTWLWEFGDGTTSINKSPTHIYTVSGAYTVKLTASKGAISDIKIKTEYIIVLVNYPTLVTEDYAVSPERSDVRTMHASSVGNYLFIKKGIRIILKSQDTGDSGFIRPNGPTVAFN